MPGLMEEFNPLRRQALERWEKTGFPTTGSAGSEEWRYTSVEPLKKIPLIGASDSTLEKLPPSSSGAMIGALRGLRPSHQQAAAIGSALGQVTSLDRPFVALNTAFCEDGVFIYLPRGTIVKEPIHLAYRAKGNGKVSYPRNLIVAEPGSQATVVETYAGPSVGTYWTNAVTEVVLGEGSGIEHYRVQEESEQAYHTADLTVRQGRQSRFVSHQLSWGAVLSRNEIQTTLAQGAECTLNGLYLVSDHQHVDNQTSIDHAEPHAASEELYKGILDGESTGVFNGKIVVRPNAQKTVARQVNKNLILSEGAIMNTKPLLEILANDVKCNHGATIGRLDETQLFYLRSRGIGPDEARGLLVYAFVGELISKMRLPYLKDSMWKRFVGTSPSSNR